MNVNQLVAYNLSRAREDLGWTQEETGQRLEQYLGKPWSKASFSVAERSVDEGARNREFDANELLAFSQVFEKPIAYFFTPPDDLKEVLCGDPLDASRAVVSRKALLEAVTPTGLALREHVAKLKRAIQEYEMADEPAIRRARKEKGDG